MLIVEGYLDLISLFQSGIEHVVATLGTAPDAQSCATTQSLCQRGRSLIRRRCGRTIRLHCAVEYFLEGHVRYFLPSAHVVPAGALEGDLHAKVVLLPQGHDPDTFVQAEGRDALLARVREAQPFIEFLLDAEAEGHDLPQWQKLAYVRKLLPLMVNLGNQVRRRVFVRARQAHWCRTCGAGCRAPQTQAGGASI